MEVGLALLTLYLSCLVPKPKPSPPQLCVTVNNVALGEQLRLATCEARNEHQWFFTQLPETPDAFSWDLAMISDFGVAAQLPSSGEASSRMMPSSDDLSGMRPQGT